ncbi:MAG: hypothetical protein ACMUEM_06420 [Flavobacteriales bacterium AspAUS03]
MRYLVDVFRYEVGGVVREYFGFGCLRVIRKGDGAQFDNACIGFLLSQLYLYTRSAFSNAGIQCANMSHFDLFYPESIPDPPTDFVDHIKGSPHQGLIGKKVFSLLGILINLSPVLKSVQRFD